ncbi:RidA family protein [Aspergillus affinis]|uniref:RidA family protein n=1 Tax=Aspergillus affinis TaxID=1070780 RepID=UPI0022FEAD00|nr:uncharacterized protein KD926_011115 [Aspergillus affinis]KAI9044942.1 hypothetical protein KD926_011115 [Aspergillus affinis]
MTMSSSRVWRYTTPEETPETIKSVEKSRKIMKTIITDKIDRFLPNNTPLVDTVTEKTHLMCPNAKAALEAAGSSLDRVVKCVILFTDIADYEESNKVYV